VEAAGTSCPALFPWCNLHSAAHSGHLSCLALLSPNIRRKRKPGAEDFVGRWHGAAQSNYMFCLPGGLKQLSWPAQPLLVIVRCTGSKEIYFLDLCVNIDINKRESSAAEFAKVFV